MSFYSSVEVEPVRGIDGNQEYLVTHAGERRVCSTLERMLQYVADRMMLAGGRGEVEVSVRPRRDG